MATTTRPTSPAISGGTQQGSWDDNTASVALSPTSTIDYSSGGGIGRSETGKPLERGAVIRANALLEQILLPSHKTTYPAFVKTVSQKKETWEAKKFRYEMDLANAHPGITKKLVADKPLESMATSTRKVNKHAKAMEGPESVEKQKCILDRAMEKEAKMRALKMVDFIQENGNEGFQII